MIMDSLLIIVCEQDSKQNRRSLMNSLIKQFYYNIINANIINANECCKRRCLKDMFLLLSPNPSVPSIEG